jgi:hypothetical protein
MGTVTEMKLKLTRSRHLVALVVLVLTGVVAGTAYALSSGGNPANGPSAANGEAAIRGFLIARLASDGRPDLAPVAGARVSTVASAGDGGEWSLSTYLNGSGDLCLSQSIPGDGRSYSCNRRSAIFANGPLYVSWGSRQLPGGELTTWDQAWVIGFAAAPVRTVELVYTDCSTKSLPLNADGAFQAVVGQSQMRNGTWPYLLRGLASDGSMVTEDRADLQQPNARGVMIKAPSPGNSCANS